MRNIKDIKKLAYESLDKNGNVDKKAADFALNKLTKKELKQFLRSLKKRTMEEKVIVRYDGPLPVSIKKDIEAKFKNKRIDYEKDKSLGGGIEIIDNDMIVNYTISGLINNRLEQINI